MKHFSFGWEAQCNLTRMTNKATLVPCFNCQPLTTTAAGLWIPWGDNMKDISHYLMFVKVLF